MLVTIWKHSSSASSKAVSTLSAHITVITLFFGPAIFIYAFPFNSYSAKTSLALLLQKWIIRHNKDPKGTIHIQLFYCSKNKQYHQLLSSSFQGEVICLRVECALEVKSEVF
ncbi:Olfactory receptor 4K15 [Manis javanica]|nr:Olfactory receptor 4K15 [Manis javanica]